ncbi:protein SMG5 [Pieris brassicae]|uniref:protein SMG5 n=1 Tax=Pieris brassicae TaxID=7116 RepID=UPI001E65E6BB|nr:protein SMG5 [Pieris brassicae]XP_045512759.1 protein SMG5 [Pieris brassicae]
MKNDCNDNLVIKNLERSEQAKKVYRYVTDVARRLGEATSASKVIADLFSIHIEVQRQKLRDNCEKLFFLDPLNYGKKSVELVWRKVYYDTIYSAKKLHETYHDCDNYLEMHIVSGIGHFHNFIAKVQAEMKVNLKDLDYAPSYNDEEFHDDKNNMLIEHDSHNLYQSILYSCLIYLGDLSRYQVEIFNKSGASIAARYYLQAAQLDLTSGMPFNQLANLYLEKNYNLDSVSSYIHCLSCLTPFEGAMGNLNKIFEKNNQFCCMVTPSESLAQSEHIQITVANFLSLIEKWYFLKDDENIPKLCSNVVQQLKLSMDFTKVHLPDINKNYNDYMQAMEEEYANPAYLNSTMIHHIVKICLFTIAKMKENDEAKSFACKAFTLAFLSQTLQKLHYQLENLGFKNPANNYIPKYKLNQSEKTVNGLDNIETQDTQEVCLLPNGSEDTYDGNIKETGSDDDKEVFINGDGKNKKNIPRRRRRRRANSLDSSDLSDNSENSSEETDQTCSDDDEDAISDSTYVSDEGNSDGSDLEKKVEEKVNGSYENTTDMVDNSERINKTASENAVISNALDSEGISNFLHGDNILPSLKLLQDWVLTEKDLILSCGESGESLFQCVVNLLNIFQHYFYKNNDLLSKSSNILIQAKNKAKKFRLDYKTIPLPEDINLRGTNIGKFDKDAAEWHLKEKLKLTEFDENIIRILNFIYFGNQIAKIVPRIKFNKTMKIFYLKKVYPAKTTLKLNHKRSREWHSSNKQGDKNEGGLLRRLGHLWLTSRVRELECTGQTEVPSLLAVDTTALYKHLRRVKQLVRTRNFIILIPSIVLQELDELKRDCSAARDAIRWLEMQLKSGSRFLRTQRPGQSKPMPLIKYPRKAPSFVHNFMQILEFCNHFNDEKQQGGNGDSEISGKSAPLLVLLVGTEQGNNEEQYKDVSLLGTAHAAGISIEFIGDFYAKWRQTSHKNGKKR